MFKLPWQAQEDAAPRKAAPQQAVQGMTAAAQGSKSAKVRVQGQGSTEPLSITKVVTITKRRRLPAVLRHRLRRVAFLDKLRADTALEAQLSNTCQASSCAGHEVRLGDNLEAIWRVHRGRVHSYRGLS